MKTSEQIKKEIDKFFSQPPSTEERAWGLIHDFYHCLLTYMEEKNISQKDIIILSGLSKSAGRKMFFKTPNTSVLQLVKLAELAGMDIEIKLKPLVL